jgi:hypothetical protein
MKMKPARRITVTGKLPQGIRLLADHGDKMHAGQYNHPGETLAYDYCRAGAPPWGSRRVNGV